MEPGKEATLDQVRDALNPWPEYQGPERRVRRTWAPAPAVQGGPEVSEAFKALGYLQRRLINKGDRVAWNILFDFCKTHRSADVHRLSQDPARYNRVTPTQDVAGPFATLTGKLHR